MNNRTSKIRWGYLLVVVLFLAIGLLLASAWLVCQQRPASGPTALLTATPSPIIAVTRTTAPTSEGPTPTATLTPEPTPTATPSVLQLTVIELDAEVDDTEAKITFRLAAKSPVDRNISHVTLWYDTDVGRKLWRSTGPFTDTIRLSYTLDALEQGLTRTLTTTAELDYWWLVRDTGGERVRKGGTAHLGPSLQALVTAPTPDSSHIDFGWAVSDTNHFRFHYVPGTAAERDLRALGTMAEVSLERTQRRLETDFDGQMRIYFVPRIFWQGGAAYGDKVQLISYLDRNYTAIETWSYFTHEGTHALAQDILQPKQNGGGPDGVLVEGLAVWASGGHYRTEPIDAWAAVVAGSDTFIPLAELRKGPFYSFQHEVSYLEGASFVKYLVEVYGLDKLKELYGLATGKADHDEDLVRGLYGKGYEALEAEWLEYLAGLEPGGEVAEALRLKVRSFDLMRRYETELDPDARILPGTSPTEWLSDTLKIFLHRNDAPVNVAFETALIAVQHRLQSGDLSGASTLLGEIETALDAGGSPDGPALRARAEILALAAQQDRAILRADADAYLATLAPESPLAQNGAVEARLFLPFTAYRQELVRLDVTDDGLRAEGMVLVHSEVTPARFSEDGRLYRVTFVREGNHWFLLGREPAEPNLPLPPNGESRDG